MKFNKTIQIQSRIISDTSPTFIIAEAGVNHCGTIEIAKKLIDIACGAKADAVKFQTFHAEHLLLKKVKKAPYQESTTSENESQFEMLKKLEFDKEQHQELKRYCEEKKIIFLTTPFDEISLEQLEELNIPAYKISSSDITNLPFLKKIAMRKKPIFLSTGMTYLEEIELALREIYPLNKDIVLFQCSSNYPLQDDEANLNVINKFKKHFDMLIGYSDHTVGIGAAPYAVSMGTKVIEKHFTVDKNLEGPDHRASLNPEELIILVQEIRKVERYLGKSLKMPTLSEIRNRSLLQKCFVAACDIKKGEIFNEDNIIAKRTGGEGISPIYYDKLVGKKASKGIKKNEIISVKAFE
ncbi:MAG: N-acetylneuraminate synthase [Candidatus Brocadiaceae bacterium]|nr:N-acetylneuraminate synthase [Candidatus Brocadiaceae bacterium]